MKRLTKEEAIKEIDERYRFWQKHYAPECEKYGVKEDCASHTFMP